MRALTFGNLASALAIVAMMLAVSGAQASLSEPSGAMRQGGQTQTMPLIVVNKKASDSLRLQLLVHRPDLGGEALRLQPVEQDGGR